jgi:ubiquitin carboxyl-terminal hydrolase 7
VQEIKFEPNVMCEPVDKKFTFKASQVYEGQRDLTREMGTSFS